jgi:hypothetical protein
LGKFTKRLTSRHKGREDGDCYPAAARLMRNLVAVGGPHGVKLVHGRPRLQRPPHIRYGHAWVEIEDGAICLNAAKGRKAAILRAIYYEAGEIDEAECFYYTPMEALAMMDHFGHFGPWEGPEAVKARAIDEPMP